MVSVFARLRFRTTALFLLAAATASFFPFAHLYEKENGVMTPPTTNPTTNPTTPPLHRTTEATSWASSFLDAAFDVRLTHTVSHQLRSLLSPLLMPLWQPALPAKVIFIPGKKNWTIATALVAILFDDRYNDLSTTAPYVDPCRITQYDLGFPFGLVAEYGGFLQSTFAPACTIPRVKKSCATFFESPIQYLLDIITNDYDAHAEDDQYILRDELEEAFWNWTHDQLDAFHSWTYDQLDALYNWTYDQLDAFYNWTNNQLETIYNRTYDQIDAFGNWTNDQLDACRQILYDQYGGAHQWLHDNKIVVEPQWWNNQLCSVLHWWRCLVQSCIDNAIGRVVFFQDACALCSWYWRLAALTCE
jgi:hypothetical protein